MNRLAWLVIFLFLGVNQGWCANTPVTIGVLAFDNYDKVQERWVHTARYLSREIPGYQFLIKPMDMEDIRWAVNNQQLDFILTNPGHYVELEAAYGSTRLVTLKNKLREKPYTVFGAVIFTRTDRDDITQLSDIEGKSLMTTHKHSFEEFQIAWRELHLLGIDPFEDLAQLKFSNHSEEAIVQAVKDGTVDVGIVRTFTLERLAEQGFIKLEDVRILNPRITSGFPFGHSTRLYPEWPFAKASHTPDSLAQQVAVALLTMPENHAAARKGNYLGWTVPLDYHLVHELFDELRIGPYHREFSLDDLFREYSHWILVGTVLMFLMGTTTIFVLQLNQRLKQSKRFLEQEIFERKRTEIVLRKLSSALEQSADIVVISDREGIIEYVNPAFEKVTGYTARDAIGNSTNILKSGSHDQTFYSRMWSTILQGNAFCEIFINRRKDGTLYYEEKTITPLKDETGQIINFVSTGKDITERMKSDEEARQREAQLAHVSRISTMGEMASSLAHELNQPLAAIVNYAHGCLRRLRMGSMRETDLNTALSQISAQGERTGEIIRRLRNFMRMSEPKRMLVEPNQVVREACNLASLEARDKHTRLKFNLAEKLPKILADPVQVQQVVLNLVHNAMEAIHSTNGTMREVEITTSQPTNLNIQVDVTDTGPGLSEEAMENVFEAFYTTKSEGMGMGLSISRSIIEAHGGHMHVNRNPNGGARFGFVLPIADEKNYATEC